MTFGTASFISAKQVVLDVQISEEGFSDFIKPSIAAKGLGSSDESPSSAQSSSLDIFPS